MISRQTNSTNEPKPVAAILGFGRFGALWAEINKNHFRVKVYDPSKERQEEARVNGYETLELKECLKADVVFFAVPMSTFESVLFELLTDRTLENLPLFADLLSVKVYPKEIFNKYLPAGQKLLFLHPLFGPDAVREQKGSFQGLPLMLDSQNLDDKEVLDWRELYTGLGLNVLPMTCEEHDRQAAWSQGIAHYVGRILEKMDLKPTSIDTLGAKKLHEIRAQVCNDTWDLFEGLQTLNPFTREMRVKLDQAQEVLLNSLIPNRRFKDRLVIGIQGGKGSFNESAVLNYLERNSITNFELVYLFRTDSVLSALHAGEIDRGQFAIHNSLGGMVAETIEAIGKFKFEIVEEFKFLISHSLMVRPEIEFSDSQTVMAHPEVFRQCTATLKSKFPSLKLITSEGELIDTARAAEFVATGKLPSDRAILGNKEIARIYGLKIVAENLQDSDNNLTSFLLVQRRSNQ